MDSLEKECTEAFEHYSDELFRHAAMRLPERERALELVQESFMKAWDYCSKGNKIDEWRPFLYRTLRHLIIDEYRRKKSVSLEGMAENDPSSDFGAGSPEALLPADESNTMEAAMDRLDAKRALALVPKLPYIYGEVLTLRYVESMTLQEIAGVVGESENVVSVRIHRGLKKLKELYDGQI